MRQALLVAVLAIAAMTTPARAQFCPGASGWVYDDVLASDPFCGYITWMAQNGVSLGCQLIDANHRLYCPNADVTRTQMAAFVARSFDMPHSTSSQIGTITKPGGSFLHDYGDNSIFVGLNAGNFSGSTTDSVGVGAYALSSNITGYGNVAAGAFALRFNDQGYRNAAFGTLALNANTSGRDNVAVGYGALRNNSLGTGNAAVGASAMRDSTGGDYNTAMGVEALAVNSSDSNSGFGANALYSNASGAWNTAIGARALLANTTGRDNTGVGTEALSYNTTGQWNTGVGVMALADIHSGSLNTAVGWMALHQNADGNRSVAVGARALYFDWTGTDNIAIGNDAGYVLNGGHHNIHIGHMGVGGDTQLIRIGNPGDQTAAYIAGIRGVTTGSNNAVNVVIDGNGQLGTISSSRAAKIDIDDMSDTSSALMQLRPVTFHYKADHDPAGPRLQYGLIAEEVAEVYPGMVATRDGKPETVMYQYLAPMLLNEYQKQQRTIEAQAHRIDAQEAQIAELKRAVDVLMARTESENRVAAR